VHDESFRRSSVTVYLYTWNVKQGLHCAIPRRDLDDKSIYVEYGWVTRNRTLSGPARLLLAALFDARGRWSHGYELSSLTGIKSGTLYPLLIRFEAQGYLEAEWQQPAASGRPPRHAYRLTVAGQQLARREAGTQLPLTSDGAWLSGTPLS
jgi:PadR family transcriptional regulator, regulatory protein PadR